MLYIYIYIYIYIVMRVPSTHQHRPGNRGGTPARNRRGLAGHS